MFLIHLIWCRMWYDVIWCDVKLWRQWMNRWSNKQDVILNDSFSGNNCPRPRLDFDVANLCAALIRNLCIGTFLFLLYLQSRPTFLTPAILCGEGSSETTLNGFLPNLSPTSRDPRRVQECQEVNRAVTWHVFLILVAQTCCFPISNMFLILCKYAGMCWTPIDIIIDDKRYQHRPQTVKVNQLNQNTLTTTLPNPAQHAQHGQIPRPSTAQRAQQSQIRAQPGPARPPACPVTFFLR